MLAKPKLGKIGPKLPISYKVVFLDPLPPIENTNKSKAHLSNTEIFHDKLIRIGFPKSDAIRVWFGNTGTGGNKILICFDGLADNRSDLFEKVSSYLDFLQIGFKKSNSNLYIEMSKEDFSDIFVYVA